MADIKGFSFPFGFSPRGGVNESTNLDKIKANLNALVLTSIGERLMSPNVGTVGYKMLYSNMSAPEVIALKYDIKTGIEAGESRVVVVDLQVTVPDTDGRAIVDITFLLNGSYEEHLLTVELEN